VTRHKHAGHCPPRGFTLIESLVVVAIIVVIVGLAGIQLVRGPGDLVREESEHLALLLRALREEAILQGRVYAFGAGRESYRFLRLERNGRLKAASGEDLFRPQRMPPGIVIEALQIEGAGEAGHDILEELQTFGAEFRVENGVASHIAAGPRQARD